MVGNGSDGDSAPLGFSPHTLDELQDLWTPLSAGELLARVGHFLRIMSQMMEEVAYMTETLAQRHRESTEEGLQGGKRHNPGSPHRRRAEQGRTPGPPPAEETPSSSDAVPRERSTRHDPVPREEHLTAEDWAIMTAVENCVVWRSLKALNLQREKLLAAICMTFQETVEGNPQRSTVGCPEDFGTGGVDGGQTMMRRSWSCKTNTTICSTMSWASRLQWRSGIRKPRPLERWGKVVGLEM